MTLSEEVMFKQNGRAKEEMLGIDRIASHFASI